MTEKIDTIFFKDLDSQDPSQVCKRALSTYDDQGQFYTLPVWGDEYRVYPRQGTIESSARERRARYSYFDLFAIQYLLNAKALEIQNQWISEKDIPGGPTFFRGPHAIPTDLITGCFKNDIKAFNHRCEKLSGRRIDMADAAFVFSITPRIPVAVLYWIGDDEFPAEAKILYDKTIVEHLASDIVYALAVGICERMSGPDDV